MTAGLDSAIACRDYRGAELAAIEEAQDCIFGGGHGYVRGDQLSGADEDTCRECAEEALSEYCRRVYGNTDDIEDWIDRVAAEATAAAQAHIDELRDAQD